jgi:hypothetical protein
MSTCTKFWSLCLSKCLAVAGPCSCTVAIQHTVDHFNTSPSCPQYW